MKTKKQLTNRILSLVLTFVMMLGMLPMTAYAATPSEAATIPDAGYGCNGQYDYYSNLTVYYKHNNYLYKAVFSNIKNLSKTGLCCYHRIDQEMVLDGSRGIYLETVANKYTGFEAKISDLPKTKDESISLYVRANSIEAVDKSKPVVVITCVGVGTPEWSWNGTSSATAMFTSTDGNTTMTVDAAITSSTQPAANCLEKDTVTYTATATANGQTYTNTKTDKGDIGPHSYTYSASEDTITEKCANCNIHNETAKLEYATGDGTYSYTGSEIKPLKVEYSSDSWQGGTLDITYQNNTAVSTDTVKATGSIAKGTATATLNFTITKGTMSGISVNGYSGVYDGKEHSISITNVPSDATVKYSTSENGTYTTTNPTYTKKGTYEVWYKIEKENYETISGSASVVISQATNSWTTEPSVDEWTYGETAKTPSAAAQFGTVKVDYRLATETDADYTTDVPTEAGSYLVRFSVEGNENYASLSKVVELRIAQVKLTVTANDKSKIYGESDPALTWQITEGKLVGTDELTDISVSRAKGNDAKDYAITVSQTEGANPNYDITFKDGTFTINQKEVDISWEATEFLPYTGSSLVPKANVTNLEAGDECILTTEVVETTDGAGIIPGTWTAKVTALSNDNYKLPESGVRVEVSFEIVNASQNYAPDGVSGVNETIDGKADGKITGVDSTMEYRKDGETEYTAINGTEVTDLADGTYYVRYAAKTYYNASPNKEVVIGAGRKLTVTVPTTQTGYTLTVADTKLVWNGSTTITFALADGYSKTNDFAVKVNGDKVELDANGKYVITNAQENITVTVEGVADTTAPTAEITLGTNKWNTFLNNITFGLFFKDTQSVTITAEDVNTGSGLDKIYYYLATEELTEDEVTALADWKEYDGAFSINPNNEYIIYAKAVDKAGNAAYISSEGIVLDAIVPVIIGVENDGTYYGNTQFSVDESYIDTVIVDENNVDLTDGKYTITADGEEHTIVAVDRAGNSSATVKITVITIASLDDTIEDIKTTDVKSSDKEDIQEVLDFVNSLIDSGKDFTDAEDKQLSDIKNNAESLLKQISDTEAEAKDLTDKVSAYEEAKVTSDDKQTIKDLVSDIDVLLNGDNLTEAEKNTLGEVKADAEALIKKIDDTAAEIKDLTDKVNDYDKAKVTSDDKQTIVDLVSDMSELIDGNNLTDTEKSALGEVKTTAEELISKIDETAAETKDLTDKVNAYEEAKVTSDDKQTIEGLIADIDELLEGDNLTEEEKELLEEVKETAKALIKKIDDTAAETKDLTDKVDAYDETKVTSEDKQTIVDLVADIDELLDGDNLTEEEKEVLGEVKADAEALIKKIDDAAAADDTDNTEKVKDITSDNVTTDDKADLEKAKDDLEKALEDYKDNLTEDEKKAIEDEIDRIDKALEVIGNVEAVVELIDKLPDTIKKDDEAAIKAADDAYNALTDYEKSLVDKDAKKALDDAKAALAELNKPADPNSPSTGDNSNMFLWIALLFISGGAVITLTVVDRKRRTASKR